MLGLCESRPTSLRPLRPCHRALASALGPRQHQLRQQPLARAPRRPTEAAVYPALDAQAISGSLAAWPETSRESLASSWGWWGPVRTPAAEVGRWRRPARSLRDRGSVA